MNSKILWFILVLAIIALVLTATKNDDLKNDLKVVNEKIIVLEKENDELKIRERNCQLMASRLIALHKLRTTEQIGLVLWHMIYTPLEKIVLKFIK